MLSFKEYLEANLMKKQEDVLDEANTKATAKIKLQHYQHKALETERNIRSADHDKNPMARHGNQAFVGTVGSKKRKATHLKIKRMKQAAATARAMTTSSDRPNYNLPKGTFLSGGKKKD